MSKKIIPIILVAVSNAIGFTTSYLCLGLLQGINIEAYGSSICEFFGTILGFLIASLTIALGINGKNISNFKKYDYFDAFILFDDICRISLNFFFRNNVLC